MKSNNSKLSDITLKEIIYRILDSWRFVAVFVIIFLVFGFFIAQLTPKEYTSSTTILPQLGNNRGIGKKFSGIAQLVGLKLGDDDANLIIPTLYPIIVNSTPYQTALLETPLKFSEEDSLVSLSYYLSEIYDKGLLHKIKSNTIGLPSKIVRSFKNSSKEEKHFIMTDSSIYSLSEEQIEQKQFLESSLSIEFNDVDGYLEIKATMPEPLAAAQITKRAQELLQKFLIDYNIQKSKDELKYIEERFNEAKSEYVERRAALGNFRDRNKNIISSYTSNREEQLQSEYDLAYAMYSQLATQMESSKLQVSKDTPIFTVLRPVTVPNEPSAPNKILILFYAAFLGFAISVIIILYKSYFSIIKKHFQR
ncbi:Wzz/FepE/Etk N-terminal domain-containing protein [Cochleicola gelatinilyticus]|uniref:Polysaccharide chain length determinant N-terminal domain-containing protein n=1 Tax=Cochleicola gelatinilyticus TaxID=1763537 RepID=A0A167G966_9FLAO|nr:Wzz/FepE/Etk N-terminal domain-containing protein [Cochleicola gelatinilyticus]OAB77349.1 hypothetical protein ULVI_12665 [Cochleicola gelatinilyticus]